MSKIPQVSEFQGLPVVTAEKMKYLDKRASLDYGIKDEILMENAGKGVFLETRAFCEKELGKDLKGVKAAVLCGRGNNGGDGLVCARHLKENGAEVRVFLVAPSDKGYGELVVRNLEKAKAAAIEIYLADFSNIEELGEKVRGCDVVLDALLGVSAVGKPVGVVKRLIQLANKSGRPVIAVDIPSGLSPDTGHHSGVFIIARLTLTLGFAKTGLMAPHAQKNTGEIKVIDIGYPKELIERAKNK